jgi:hypothetical protein
MLNLTQEKFLARIIAVGIAFTTIFVVGGSVTDPVNVTKFLALGITSVAALGGLISNGKPRISKDSAPLLLLLVAFILFAFLSVALSKSPFSQGIYGLYGRNNGFATYLFLAILLFGASKLRRKEGITLILKALIFAGMINVVYCLWVIVFGDFIGWTNPYGNILGTFGNPNFIGAFLGIFISVCLGFSLGDTTKKWLRISLVAVMPLTAFEIFNSHAIQGRVVGATGIGIILFYFIRSKFHKLVTWTYVSVAAVASLFALMGALQVGPLTSYIYKTSVSLRGQYWLAGWNTGINNPAHGVGMDAFGDWYRRSRDSHALELPGVNTIVNASHNVPLDIFAFGGWPLFLSYVLLMGYGGLAIFKTTIRFKKFDPTLSVLASSWVGYQLQSIISINQIGLAVWGWVITGAAIAYEKSTRHLSQENGLVGKKANLAPKNGEQDIKTSLFCLSFAAIGLMLALPPFASDTKWRSAQVSRSVQEIEKTMNQSYFNPQNSFKYLSNIQVLEQNQLFELSHKYALEATNWNPESFELWKVLYLIKNSTAEEKALALKEMKRLDPLNPDVTSIK